LVDTASDALVEFTSDVDVLIDAEFSSLNDLLPDSDADVLLAIDSLVEAELLIDADTSLADSLVEVELLIETDSSLAEVEVLVDATSDSLIELASDIDVLSDAEFSSL
ncbi:hypothetical protein ACLUWZ_11090, partial [Limosilactobacillus mucosae]